MEGMKIGRLYRRYRHAIYSRAIRLLADESSALDVVQETFVRALRHQDKLEAKADPGSWLCRIATNICFDELRKRRDAKVVYRGQETQGACAHGNSEFGPLVGYEMRILRESLQQSLETLEPRQHRVFVMREFEGLSYQEIAKASECPAGTVMSRLFHARRKLREELRLRLELEPHEVRRREPAGGGRVFETSASPVSVGG